MTKYILYARKSTDVEDKQVLSIEAQITELKEFAKKLDLHVIDTLIEKQTAKKPGRPVFGGMLERIKDGEADGILAWLPDRLSRNSIDSGQVIYMLDEHQIEDLKFPHFWFENTPQGKYMLANEFNSSKQFVDNLSVNTKRGLRAKVRAGHAPRLAPVGYLNDLKTRTIYVDKKTAPIIRRVFELYATGTKTLDDIAAFLYANGIRTRGRRKTKHDPKSAGGNQWHASRVKNMLSDVFYYGHFKYVGVVYEGVHTPIIDKSLFDKVQRVLTGRGRVQKLATAPRPLNMLVRCGHCGCFVTGSHRVKHQKNGNVHEYTYYRCTHKKKAVVCREKEVREYVLAGQLLPILQSFALPKDWRDYMVSRLEQDETAAEDESAAIVRGLRDELDTMNAKLKRLFDVYLEGDIDRDSYKDRQAEIMSEKKSLEAKMEQTLTHADHWIEPLRNWLETAVSICSIDEKSEHSEIAGAFRQIEGLNLKMKNKKVVAERDAKSHSPQETLWYALRATKEKIAHSGDNSWDFSNLVALIDLCSSKYPTGIETENLRRIRGSHDSTRTTGADTLPDDVQTSREAPMPHRKWKRLSAEARAQVVARYSAGDTTTALAKDYDVAKSTIIGILRANNVVVRRQPMTAQQVGDAARLYETGLSLSQVAATLDVNQETMRVAIIKAGVVLREPTRAKTPQPD